MSEKNLFRQEVMAHKRNYNYGVVSINTPLSYFVWVLFFTTIIFFILLFIMLADYAEKFIVTGYLNFDQGIVRIYPNKNGLISQCTVNPGDYVKKGQILFLIHTSFDNLAPNNNPNLIVILQKRKRALDREIEYKNKKLRALKTLLAKHYISTDFYHQKRQEISLLDDNRHLIDSELLRARHEQAYYVRAPITGTIASINYHLGQYTDVTKPLISLLPLNAKLVAEIFIPIKQSGFISPHNQVIIRYDAYPHQRFGSYKAQITRIDQSFLMDKEEDKPLTIGEPYYKVHANLTSQFVTLYGQEKKLQHGMTFSAVILGSKRKIWQWILDPLYSLYGEIRL